MIFLKKYILVFLFVCASLASAHELLPKVLQQYLVENPSASPDQIQDFMRAQSPEFAEEYKDKEKVIEIIRNQETGFFDNMYDFFKLGVHHILSGLDHILFVLSLLLVFVSVREVLKLTITFTLAHSITLLLAGAGILTLSPKIVEPIIALSISFVALTSVFFAQHKYIGGSRVKIAMVFIFGLFHGLGFAGLLQEIHIPEEKFISSLLSFNLGIEIGQIVIVLLILPLVYYVRNKTWNNTVMKIFASIIGLLGIVWAVQRIIV